MRKTISLALAFICVACTSSSFAVETKPCPASGSFHNCYGTYTFANGNRYVGEWMSNAPRGRGVMYFQNGDTYTGEFGVGATGKYTFIDGRPSIEAFWYFDNTLRKKNPNFSRGDDIVGSLPNPTTPAKELISANRNDAERDRLTAELEDSRKKQLQLMQELESRKINEAQTSSSSANQSEQPKIIWANRRALVIGNDSYKAIPKLLAAREDARTVASNLTAVGYQVTLKLDLTEKEMKAALRNFAAQVQGGDEVMFFFAGHGVQLGSTNYLLPTDIVGESEAQVRDEAIQLQ